MFSRAVLLLGWASTAYGLSVSVLVHNQKAVPAYVLERSLEIAGDAFRAAGIEMEWRIADATPFDPHALYIAVLPGAARTDAGHAILVKEGFSTMARVFYGKVEELSFDYHAMSFGPVSAFPVSATQPVILGIVLAHEMAHLLLGPNSHRPGGIMDRTVQADAVLSAFSGKLRFDEQQAAGLRFEIMTRELHRGGFGTMASRAPGVLECDLLSPGVVE